MKICFVKYPGKATLVEPLVAAAEQLQEQEEAEDEDEDGDHHRDHVDCKVVNDDNNNNCNYVDDVVVCEEPLPGDDMNSYEASWQECRLKWCLRSRSKERHGGAAAGWTDGDDDGDGNSCSDGGRARTAVAGRRNPPEKRQACSSDSTGSSQEEQDAAAFAAASSRRPKAKPLSRVQSVRHDTASHRYRTRQRVAAEMLDEQRAAEASAAAARDLCRSSAAKIKKSLSFRNPAPKKVATGGDRLLRPVSDDDYHHHNNNNNNNINVNGNRQHHLYNRHHDSNSNHHHHLLNHDDQLQQQEQLQEQLQIAVSATAVPSVSTAIAADSGSGQDNFAIPRPKLIVPVHTYGLRKRRTGNTISSNRTASDVNATSASSTIASSSSTSGSSSNTAAESKKHHNSCPGKNTIRYYILTFIDAYLGLQYALYIL